VGAVGRREPPPIGGVFIEVEASQPDSVSYVVLRLEDESFRQPSFHDHGTDVVDPITSMKAYARF